MSNFKFRTQFSEPIQLVVDDGEPVEGFIPGASESPETLLARLRQGGEVALHDGSRFLSDDFFDASDALDNVFEIENEPEAAEKTKVEENSTPPLETPPSE